MYIESTISNLGGTGSLTPARFQPRSYQIPVSYAMQLGVDRFVMVWHRRAGKDTTCLNVVIDEMFRRVGSYYHLFPTATQGRKIMWNGRDRMGMPVMDYFPKSRIKRKREQEMMIEMNNRSIYQVVGTDKGMSYLRGTNPVGLIFSEYAQMNPSAWDIMRPILRENKGWAMFPYTPFGENHGYDLFKMAKDNEKWFCSILTVNDTLRPDGTPVITPEDIQEERNENMSEEMIDQEYYCSFQGAVPGAYFAKEMKRAKRQGRITKIPFETALPVDTWWDLGIDDSMSVWFTQTLGNQVRCINYIEETGLGLPQMASILSDMKKSLGYMYGEHHAPHDISVRELGTGVSRQETGRSLGLDFVVGKRVQKKEDAIEAARQMIAKCWFDDDLCSGGLASLRNYRSEYDELRKVKKKVPVHDWATHGADAFMELAMNHQASSFGHNQGQAESDYDVLGG